MNSQASPEQSCLENIAVPVPDIEECVKVTRKKVDSIEGRNSPAFLEDTGDFNLLDYDFGDNVFEEPAQLTQNIKENDSEIPELIKEKHSEPSDDCQPEWEAVPGPSGEEQKLEPSPQISSPRELPSCLPESRKGSSNNESEAVPGPSGEEQKLEPSPQISSPRELPSCLPESRKGSSNNESEAVPGPSGEEQKLEPSPQISSPRELPSCLPESRKGSSNNESEAVPGPSGEEQKLEPSPQISSPRELPSCLPESRKGSSNNESEAVPGPSGEEQKLEPSPQICSPRELPSCLPESRKGSSNNESEAVPGPSGEEQKLEPSPQISSPRELPSCLPESRKGSSNNDFKYHQVQRCDFDLRYIPTDSGEYMRSFGKIDYVFGKWQNNRLISLHSCQFTLPFGNRTVFMRKQVLGYLFTFDEEDFIARVHCGKLVELDFAEFSINTKRDFLKKLRFVEIIRDQLINHRNAIYQQFKQLLLERSSNTVDDIVFANDIFQLYTILGNYRQSSNILILNVIVNNKYISPRLEEISRQLLDKEKALNERNRDFLKSAQSDQMDLLNELHEICARGAANHKKYFLTKCSSSISPLAASINSNISALSGQEVFYICNKDINLFLDLANGLNEQIFSEFLNDSQVLFFKRVVDKKKHKSLKDFLPSTHLIYFYLCKYFQELILEISRKTSISINDLLKKEKQKKWVLIKAIGWPSPKPLNNCLEQQYRFVFNLIKHFGPGYYTETRKFKYEFRLLQRSYDKTILESIKNLFYNSKMSLDMPENRLVWMYLFDSAIAEFFSNKSEKFSEIFGPVLEGFKYYIQEINRAYHESFRILTYNTATFVAQTITYFSKESAVIDQTILTKQIKFMEEAISENQLNSFRDLMDVCNEYWKNRESIIEEIPDQFPYGKFKQDMKNIRQKLFNITNTVLSKEVKPQVLINYFRSFNEFLKQFSAIEFKWFIKKISFLPEDVVELINEEKESYKVLDPETFIKQHKTDVPRHYLIEIAEGLLDIVSNLLGQERWSDDDNVNAANELFSAIKKSFLYLEEQPNYLEFSTFKDENIRPFASVLENSRSYKDFKNRIVIVGRSFWYLRKQDEINIVKALELCREQNGNSILKTKKTLEDCYQKYINKFRFYIESTIDKNYEDKIKYITEKVIHTVKDQSKFSNINKWDKNFKTGILPELLAGLAAAWSVEASKDTASSGKILKPHCIQVLCIFRLLSVDKNSEGVDKHLAQVLTGQGKSLILGFLSSLLALMGYTVHTVCYSKYLISRDAEDFNKVFKVFGISDKITYCTFEDMANKVIEPKINGKKRGLRELVEDRIRKDSMKLSEQIQHEDISNTILLIDEVDVFFTDRFYGKTYSPCVLIKIPALARIQEEIWNLARQNYEKRTILEKVEEFTDKMVKERTHDFIKFNEFRLEPKEYYLLKQENSVISKTKYNNQSLYEEHLQKMVDTAINVARDRHSTKRYSITDSGMICYTNVNGINCMYVFSGYQNVFSYFSLKGNNYRTEGYHNYGYLNIYCGDVSYAKLPERYPLILGVSGTLTTLNDYERETVREFYSIEENSVMPSFYGRSNLKFDAKEDVICLDSEEIWLDKILSHANSKIESGRSVIIFFETDVELNRFKETCRDKFDRLYTLTENTDSRTKKKYIDEAGVTKTVTLATRGMGRGIDFKSSDAVEKNGGVHVIQTFFSLDVKEETQIKGRTARKDNKGSYQLILCKKHLIDAKVATEQEATVNYTSLCAARNELIIKKCSTHSLRIKESEHGHNTTIRFLESFFKT